MLTVSISEIPKLSDTVKLYKPGHKLIAVLVL